jgi:ligand-binding SRPBCC domain-containing protein
MKRSVRQVDVRQHHNQKHEKNHATEDEERRTLYVPLRHSPFSFARVGDESQPLKTHKPQNEGLGLIIREKLERNGLRWNHSPRVEPFFLCKQMHTYCLEREQWLPRAIDEVFAFFSRPENLQVITPPWLDFRMVKTPDALLAGSLIRYRLRWHFVPIRWTTEITEWNPPNGFVDRQLRGPYALWNHEHSFVSHSAGTVMRDRVTYALPLGWAGRLARAVIVKQDVERIFDFRAKTMQRLFPEDRQGAVNES